MTSMKQELLTCHPPLDCCHARTFLRTEVSNQDTPAFDASMHVTQRIKKSGSFHVQTNSFSLTTTTSVLAFHGTCISGAINALLMLGRLPKQHSNLSSLFSLSLIVFWSSASNPRPYAFRYSVRLSRDTHLVYGRKLRPEFSSRVLLPTIPSPRPL